MSDKTEKMIDCDNVVKIYKTKDIEVIALQGLDLHVDKGEMMAIIGNSGSGKSTLLNSLGALDRPSAGQLFVDGKNLLKMTERDLIAYKRDTVGFMWQNNARNMIPYLTVLENVQIPMFLKDSKVQKERAKELLSYVGLDHRYGHKLNQLSGGEQQRVAIAIALANNPKILLADEPTGAVDTKATLKIFDMMRSINEKLGTTIVVVTHDRQISTLMDRVVAIRDGKTSSEWIRRISYSSQVVNWDGEALSQEESHEELAVLDRAGRIQIPDDYLKALSVEKKGKVKMELEDKKIVIRA